MTTIDIKQLTALVAIGQKALEAHDAKQEERAPRDAFHMACNRFKHVNDIEFIHKHTNEWDAMCEATADEYAPVEAAERKTRNARRRLETAIRNYRRSEVAE